MKIPRSFGKSIFNENILLWRKFELNTGLCGLSYDDTALAYKMCNNELKQNKDVYAYQNAKELSDCI